MRVASVTVAESLHKVWTPATIEGALFGKHTFPNSPTQYRWTVILFFFLFVHFIPIVGHQIVHRVVFCSQNRSLG